MLATLAKLLKVLNSETSPWSLAWGISLGMVLGLTPLFSLHNLLVLFAVLALRINLSFFLISFTVCSGLAYLLDPAFNYAGELLLTSPKLLTTWQALYDLPLARLAQFNHTITLGSVAVALVLLFPVLVMAHFIIINYRTRIQIRISRLPIVNIIKGTKFWSLYQKASQVKKGLSS
ncbi:TIGR03546 family protein [Aliidiomarina quisquiliarum]|uniref:TIGR03546 family protein n=1 Tax=Aliidiomarina quisquiliarum TaxID=2938947 RepID=UPI00208F20A2|nr:TIGR03546 family protein [Aliidiomarina quisquiliarum]